MEIPAFNPMREPVTGVQFGSQDYLVLFGELFGKGYANGIINEAHSRGMKIIGSTVGRRDSEGKLRPLTDEELNAAKLLAPFHDFINVPLEAGFDLEPDANGKTPVEQLQGVKMDQWNQISLNWSSIEQSRAHGRARFRTSVERFVQELSPKIPAGARVTFVHTMAGGIPRAKILMPTMNKVFKGRGERFVSSEEFWKSQLGRLCEMSFREVTAETLTHLIEGSQGLRDRIEKGGGRVSYVAYGYHGCEILLGGSYTWQSYTPYLQGWAKIDLENVSRQFSKRGVKCCVFNAPEILTNSSNLFQGVEIPLYMFLAALKHEGPRHSVTESVWKHTAATLKAEFSNEKVLSFTEEVMASKFVKGWCRFENWPQHSGRDQMEYILNSSDHLIDMHADAKNMMTLELSRLIFEATGKAMLAESWNVRAPVFWLGHDVLARILVSS